MSILLSFHSWHRYEKTKNEKKMCRERIWSVNGFLSTIFGQHCFWIQNLMSPNAIKEEKVSKEKKTGNWKKKIKTAIIGGILSLKQESRKVTHIKCTLFHPKSLFSISIHSNTSVAYKVAVIFPYLCMLSIKRKKYIKKNLR